MSVFLLAVLGVAQAAPPAPTEKCGTLRIRDVVADAGPGVLFVGMRHGTRRDLAKARRLVKKLALVGPVTVAMEPVSARKQEALDRLDLGKLPFDRLSEALEWDTHHPFDYATYAPLFALHSLPTVSFVGAGVPVELAPEDAPVTVPPGYASLLSAHTRDGPVPARLEARFSETVAWHDRRVAEAALAGWHGRGWLVVVVDRTWLEGGLGMSWQAELMTDAPVSAALLAKGGRSCFPGDRVLK